MDAGDIELGESGESYWPEQELGWHSRICSRCTLCITWFCLTSLSFGQNSDLLSEMINWEENTDYFRNKPEKKTANNGFKVSCYRPTYNNKIRDLIWFPDHCSLPSLMDSAGIRGPPAVSVVKQLMQRGCAVCVDHRLITPVIAGLLQTAEHRLLIDKAPLGLIHSSSTWSRQENSGKNECKRKESPMTHNTHWQKISCFTVIIEQTVWLQDTLW